MLGWAGLRGCYGDKKVSRRVEFPFVTRAQKRDPLCCKYGTRDVPLSRVSKKKIDIERLNQQCATFSFQLKRLLLSLATLFSCSLLKTPEQLTNPPPIFHTHKSKSKLSHLIQPRQVTINSALYTPLKCVYKQPGAMMQSLVGYFTQCCVIYQDTHTQLDRGLFFK